jgi:cell division protein FtsZ
MNYLQDHYSGKPDIKACTVEGEGMEDRVLVTVLASGFDQEDELLEGRRHSLNLGAAEAHPAVSHYAASSVVVSQPLPTQVVSGRVYGEMPVGEQGPTPTRLMPQAPTPSGELPGVDDLHVPAIMRMGSGRLPIE